MHAHAHMHTHTLAGTRAHTLPLRARQLCPALACGPPGLTEGTAGLPAGVGVAWGGLSAACPRVLGLAVGGLEVSLLSGTLLAQ